MHGRLCCPKPNAQSQRRAAQRPCSLTLSSPHFATLPKSPIFETKIAKMTAITIQVSNEVAETVGVGELEKQINDLIARVALKLAAKEMLKDLKAVDLSKDPEWAKARAAAWEQEKANVLKKLNKRINA